MGRLKDSVRAKLDGYEHRQAIRLAAQAWRRKAMRVSRWRSTGRLDRLKEATKLLESAGVRWHSQSIYGMTILHTEVEVLLSYRPDGTLDYQRRLRKCPMPVNTQESLFTFVSSV